MEPIAIIGTGCRFPGANNPESFWQLLRNGVDTITEVPKERWDIDALYDPKPATPEKMNTRCGGFLEQVDQFEPSFFGISPREAEPMDPQQRLLLEVAWEALENAAIVPQKLAGSKTGVFIGICNADYHRLIYQDSSRINAHSGTGTAFSIAANRLSYVLDLRGPSVAIDTACSSSLVAVHFACQSLHNGESNLCLVGGVNLILSPEPSITFSQAHMMSADGRCKTFDASANGYVRGEGCGIVVLKRLKDALRDKDNIQAIIKGSAVNQDGLSNGLTAPNGPSQQAVIREALENAGVASTQISYVEAHGTATSLGDPIEVKSLKAVLMQGREPDQPCWIGSVKTNIGHLEGAAGIAGLIKVVLSLQHAEIPPNLHLEQLNPYISLKGTTFSIPTERQPWVALTERRLAGVSSFGFGGTNCHVILEEAPPTTTGANDIQPKMHLLTLSAKSEKALSELAQSYVDFLASHPEVSLFDVCFTANTGRSHFNHRLAVVAESTVQLREQLEAFAAKKETAKLVSGQVNNSKRQKIAFLFTGQGSQYLGMGRQLYENAPIFRQAIDRCDEILRPYLGQSLLQVLYPKPGEASPLDQTAYTQPALFALEYALVQLWKSWGIHPSAVMGHSVGEYVAATVAGVFTLEDGLKLISERARLMQSLPTGGEMVAVFASPAFIRKLHEIDNNKVSFAAYNGLQNTVISGEAQFVQAICTQLEAAGIKTKKLQTSHAFHSPLMEPILAQFREVADNVTYAAPQMAIVSNLTGEQLTSEAITPDYWCRHLRSPVEFAESIKTLHTSGYEVFVEIGPKPTLLGMGRNCLPDVETSYFAFLPSLRQGQSDCQQMLESLGELYVHGVEVDWSGFYQENQGRRVNLPTYPWERSRYWIETKLPSKNSQPLEAWQNSNDTKGHPLLGSQLKNLAHLPNHYFWEIELDKRRLPYLTQHRLLGAAVVPVAVYLEMALVASEEVFGGFHQVRDLELHNVLFIPENGTQTVQIILASDVDGLTSFQVYSRPTDADPSSKKWTLHATAKIAHSNEQEKKLCSSA
ncbi:beta-ketoacyl synthase [Tolypothrix sp. NIES-4075]|uniref:type I polyketide synthase n=1 Tax=Tolypothrix sp. NIES-4075 TaxID=2005459 RepID=UPI000B5CFC06|nr:type I polyketide synthase [Tolypothrix sp. NIES-4075]GAX39733.1 beta-ketoacyl synthase [Tolypothrix sp. NIES-4075]